MDREKQEKLEAAGWKVGSIEEFLGLSTEESVQVESRLRQRDEPDPPSSLR